MAASPFSAALDVVLEVEDQAGQHSIVRINAGYAQNILTNTDTLWTNTASAVLQTIFSNGGGADVVTAFAALTNAKIVRAGYAVNADWAAEPTGESGKQQYVQSKARTQWMDGHGIRAALSIPAPVDALFLTGVGMQTVVNPALSLAGGGGILGALQTAVATMGGLTAGRGVPLSIFNGGQLVIGKAPTKRRIQGQ